MLKKQLVLLNSSIEKKKIMVNEQEVRKIDDI